MCLPYYSVIRQGFPIQNNQEDLDPSCKTGLDLWDCCGEKKIITESHKTHSHTCGKFGRIT